MCDVIRFPYPPKACRFTKGHLSKTEPLAKNVVRMPPLPNHQDARQIVRDSLMPPACVMVGRGRQRVENRVRTYVDVQEEGRLEITRLYFD